MIADMKATPIVIRIEIRAPATQAVILFFIRTDVLPVIPWKDAAYAQNLVRKTITQAFQ
jgi:hypothetical protein